MAAAAMPNVMRGGNAMAGGDLLAQLMPFVTAGLLPSVLGSPFARPAGSATAFQGTPRPNMQLRGSAFSTAAGRRCTVPSHVAVREGVGIQQRPQQDYDAYERPGQQSADDSRHGWRADWRRRLWDAVWRRGVRRSPEVHTNFSRVIIRSVSAESASRPPQYQGSGSTMLPILGPSLSASVCVMAITVNYQPSPLLVGQAAL